MQIIWQDTNGKGTQWISNARIALRGCCVMCPPASPKQAININATAVLNTNQSAYKPKKLTQRCGVVRWTSQQHRRKKKEAAFSQWKQRSHRFLKHRATKNKCWKSQNEPHHEIWKFSGACKSGSFRKKTKKMQKRNKQATQAQPPSPETQSNKEQMLEISTSTPSWDMEILRCG